jgi:hypothetical protein
MAEKVAAKTVANVIAGFVESLVVNQSITADVAGVINSALAHRAAEVEAAIAAVKSKAKE